MSSFAEDKVKKYIKGNLTKFYRIRVAQMICLPCFTDTDRQEISAYYSRHGNNLAVFEFFERLQSREGWLQVLIDALREDNLGDLADDLQRVYNMYQPRNALSNSSSPVVNSPPSRELGAFGISLPSSAEQNPSPPFNIQSSREARPSAYLPPKSPGFASSTRKPDLPAMSDYHRPVQETDFPSQNSEISAEPKDHLGEVPGTPAPVASRSDFSSVAPKWGNPQPRPVFVKSGYFGNMSRMAGDTGASPTPVAHLGTKTSGNQPVEDHYSSADNVPAAAPKRQDDSQKEEQLGAWKTQIQWGYQKKRALGDPVESDSSATSSLQRQLGVEQGAPNQWKNSPIVTEKNVGTTSEASPVLSRTHNSWERGGHVPTNTASRGHSSVPRFGSTHSNHSQQPWSPTENAYVSPNPTTLLPWQRRPPLPDFEGFSSTDVIPPNSHMEPSSASSRGDLEDLKSPIQEEKWPVGRLDDSHTSALVQETVSVTQPPDIADGSTMNSRMRRNGSSRNDRVFYSSHDDDGPCKPGVLTSCLDASSLGQLQSGQETDPEYSGRSDRLCFSSEFSLNGDPLMPSDPSQNGQPEEKSSGSAVGIVLGKTGMGEGDSASFQAMNDNQDVSGSIRTFELRVKEDASINLAGAPNTIGYQELQPNQSPGAFPHSATGHPSSMPTDPHSEDSHQNQKTDGTPPWIPSDYTLLLVGFVLASVAGIAFILYKKK
ncbi:mitochondrial antiviral-signaling protein isoform X2 [Sceloporus undulatus]|uniref:mitochondrial antiviral-signaling protein isoform X2 n=1 Tax=Sceloporus undulatus TaxID=8520 RepID=UPI001C4D7872|nr:mitochondrial antiviral-signaling protein isoform X2 [Sceloporus undulatus]